MDDLDEIKAKVEKLTNEQEAELRAWLDARETLELSDSKSPLSSSQEALVRERMAAPREYASDVEIRNLLHRFAGSK